MCGILRRSFPLPFCPLPLHHLGTPLPRFCILFRPRPTPHRHPLGGLRFAVWLPGSLRGGCCRRLGRCGGKGAELLELRESLRVASLVTKYPLEICVCVCACVCACVCLCACACMCVNVCLGRECQVSLAQSEPASSCLRAEVPAGNLCACVRVSVSVCVYLSVCPRTYACECLGRERGRGHRVS